MEDLLRYILGGSAFTVRQGSKFEASNEFEVLDVDLSAETFKGLPGEWTFVLFRGEALDSNRRNQLFEQAKVIARIAYSNRRLPFFISQGNSVPLENIRFWDTPAFYYKMKGNHDSERPPARTPFFLSIKTRVIQNAKLVRVLLPDITKPAKSWSFFGRDRELNDLVYTNSNYIVAGGRRIGKTSLLQAVDRKLRSLGTNVISLDVQAFKSVEDVIFELAKVTGARDLWREVRKGRVYTEQLLQDSLKRLGRDGKSAVLLMDEFGNLLTEDSVAGWQIFGAIRKYSQAGGFRFIFTCFHEAFLRQMDDPSGPLVNAAETLRLAPFTDKEVEEFFFSIIQYWATPPANDKRQIMDMILSRVGPHPYALVSLCSSVVNALVASPEKTVLAAVNECVHAKLLETFTRTFDEIFHRTKDATLKYTILTRLDQTEKPEGFARSSAVIDDDWLQECLRNAGFVSTLAGRTKIFAGLEMHGFTGRDRSQLTRQRIALPLLYHYLIEANRTIAPMLRKLKDDMMNELREYDLTACPTAPEHFYET